jgi:hypothetical protein
MHLECIDSSIKMVTHLTKALNWALFHCHADFCLGHIPPMYSPVYKSIVRTYTDQNVAIENFVPDSFTTPMCAAAARVDAPLHKDYADSPWLNVLLWHG